MHVLRPIRAFGVLAVCSLTILPACTISVKKDDNGQEKKVDINTPFGGIHVNNDANVADTGLAVYPGARVTEKETPGEEKNANVNLSAFGYGIKVVAVEYESDDAPAKLIAYYKDQLKKYGSVLECHTHRLHDQHADMHTGGGPHHSKELACEGDNTGQTVELKVGTEESQHVVSIEPEGKGSRFALVYVQLHGKDTI